MHFSVSEITSLIAHRRTIYPEQFSDRKIHREIVEKLLDAARWAPNHGMTQPWRFKVFSQESAINLSTFLSGTYQEMFTGPDYNEKKHEMLRSRPLKSAVSIAVCMSPDKSGRIPEIEEIEAVACAVQNMALVAAAYGLGMFWSTPKIVYSIKMNEFLKLESQEKCLGIIYLGYPAIEWPKGQRRPIEYFTEWI
jgi:nitroreductase